MEEFASSLLDIVLWTFMWYSIVKVVEILFVARQLHVKTTELREEIYERLLKSVHSVKQEKHGELLYWFDDDNDRFLAQGKDSTELIEHLKSRFKDHIFIVDENALLIGPEFKQIDVTNKTAEEIGKYIADTLFNKAKNNI
jgi:hypothetical protein